MNDASETTVGDPIRVSALALTAVFVRAAGMADDTAYAWLDGMHEDWERVWTGRGAEVLAELDLCGHARLSERLLELLGPPADGRRRVVAVPRAHHEEQQRVDGPRGWSVTR